MHLSCLRFPEHLACCNSVHVRSCHKACARRLLRYTDKKGVKINTIRRPEVITGSPNLEALDSRVKVT